MSDPFQTLTEPYQHELLVHCYRFFGSLDDAEDALQETLLRAWRRWDTLKSPTSLRPWLYRIATNVSLDMLDQRKTRGLPPAASPPARPQDPLPKPVIDPIWIDPLPDEYLDVHSANPEARYELRESVSLAFLAVLQSLPARQRVAFILMDVLGWSAADIAELLGQSVAAVNSAGQRARATLKASHLDGIPTRRAEKDPQTTALLARYIQAWENADADRLAALLSEDVILTMPPIPAWYSGRAAVKAFLETHLFTPGATGRFRLAAVQANGCPAFAVYTQDETGVYHPGGIQVIRLAEGLIVQIDDFLAQDDRLFRRFGLPLSI
jgi:RNA polymerase sigma-70 factor, ECF subfamily